MSYGLAALGAKVLPYLASAGKQISPFVSQRLEGGMLQQRFQPYLERIQPHLQAGKDLINGDKTSLSDYHNNHIAPRLNSLSDYSAGISRRAARVSTLAGNFADATGTVSDHLKKWGGSPSSPSDTTSRIERPIYR